MSGLSLSVVGDFHLLTNGCSATLAAGASCSSALVFSPTIKGGRTGILTVASTTAGVGSVSAALTGTALSAALLSWNAAKATFPTTLLGQVSATQVLTLKNLGASSITDLSLFATAGFQIDLTQTTCTSLLPANASCAVGLLFAPTIAGAATGTITASSALSAKTGTTPASEGLSGIGAVAPGLTISPGVVNFGSTGLHLPAPGMPVTIGNQGTVSPLTGLTLAVDATGKANGFGINNGACGSTLAAAATCVATVTFTPTSSGILTGTLVVSSPTVSSALNVQLAGIGFDFQMAVVGSGSISVVAGQTAYYTLGITPLGGAIGGSGVFSFQCSGLPANAACLFNPPQLTGLPTNVTANVTMGISTGGPVASAVRLQPAQANSDRHAIGWRGGLLLGCGLLALPLIRRRRSYTVTSKSALSLLLLVTMLSGAILMMSSCVGSGGSGGLLHTGGSTPAGTYPIVVTTTSAGVQHSSTVTLTIN